MSKIHSESNKRGGRILSILEYGPVYAKVFNLIKEGFNIFVFKGSRGSMKTTKIIKFILNEMILDPQTSVAVVMRNRNDHSKTTMREFDKWIVKKDKKNPGYAARWRKVDSQVDKVMFYHHNGHNQEIRFLGIDELSSAGDSPLPNCYYKILWLEEPVSSKEQFGIDEEKKEETYDSINTFKLTILRHFNQYRRLKFESDEQWDLRSKTEPELIQFFSFNPYNSKDPLLKNFNKYNPDEEKQLSKFGYSLTTNEELKEVYFTTNHLMNPFLPKQFIKELERYKKEDPDYYRTVGLGMNAMPPNSTYSRVWKTILKYQNYSKPTHFKNFVIGIDAGGGSNGLTAMVLVGKSLNDKWYFLEEWDEDEYRKELKGEWNPDKIALLMVAELNRWELEYKDLNKNIRPIAMDLDRNFKQIFINAIKRHHKIKPNALFTKFRIILFLKKFYKEYSPEERILPISHAFGTGQLILNEKWTPKLFRQFEEHRMEKGKVVGGNDDMRNAAEMAICDIVFEMVKYDFYKGKLMDNWVLDIIERKSM